MGMGNFKTEAEQLEELSKKLHKTADEVSRLNRANREKNAGGTSNLSVVSGQGKLRKGG